jgi:uncharacterized protein YlxW (UPF0749 family)
MKSEEMAQTITRLRLSVVVLLGLLGLLAVECFQMQRKEQSVLRENVGLRAALSSERGDFQRLQVQHDLLKTENTALRKRWEGSQRAGK